MNRKNQPTATPSPPAVADRRTALLEATVEQIARRGTRGMRIEEVAKAAGVSPALVYHHFDDRSSLLIAALEYIGERANTYTAPRGRTGHAKLLNLMVNEVQDIPAVRINSAAWGELRDTAIFDEALRPTLGDLTARWIDDIAQLVAEGQRDASVNRNIKPRDAGIRLSAVVEGLSSRWLAGLLSTEETRQHIKESARALIDPRL